MECVLMKKEAPAARTALGISADNEFDNVWINSLGTR